MYIQLLLKVLVFNICFPKEEKEKNGEKQPSPFSALEVASPKDEESCNNKGKYKNSGHLLSVWTSDQKQQSVIGALIPNIWRKRVIFAHPGSHSSVQAAAAGTQCTSACFRVEVGDG